MLITKLHLLSDNLESTEEFYHQILGLNILQKSNDLLVLEVGQTVLSVHQSDLQKPQYHFAFNIPCNKIEEALAWIKGKATVLDVAPNEPIADFKNWNARAVYFLDNNENILELIARNDLRNERDDPFGPDLLLSVCEIGIVCDNVGQQSQFLIDRYQLDYFSKQPPLPTFSALGDDSGLFIIVPHSREWYPTNIRSTKNWLKVHININGREEELELHGRSSRNSKTKP